MSRFQYSTPELRASALAHLARTGDLPALRTIRPPPTVRSASTNPPVTQPTRFRHHVAWREEYERVKKLPKLPPPTDPRRQHAREQYRREVRDVARRHHRRKEREANLPVDDSTIIELCETDDAIEDDSALVAAEVARIEREVKQRIADGELEISEVLPPNKMNLVTDILCKTELPETELPKSEPAQGTELLAKQHFQENFEKNHQKLDDYIAARAMELPAVKAKRSERIQERREAKAAKKSGLWDTITSTISSSFSLMANPLLWGDTTTDDATEAAHDDATDPTIDDEMTEKSGLLSKTAGTITMSLTRMWRILIQKAGFPCA
ncbi:hypothetical protein DOTSEDRAFT_32072 [Dothistroma septosporum NZE10]|uniref:Uncharacterized protein n=1 Tax=Dothistroma septosporum (strain NZE10 / CBS 128990) TaxID=675120 RepID=N1PW06_DOTSN|nr:hypothetical protein DOTSEDRAFT_32072 [Dothistroma septosporum NZE10]